MIADAKVVLQSKSLPTSLWSQAIHHATWIKNHTPNHSLDSKITLYQAYYGKWPSLATLCLFGCKAYAHTQKVNQSKFMECTTECIHIGFAEEKKAYLLYSCEHRKIFELQDVEFEGMESWEQVTVDSDIDEEGDNTPVNAGNGDPEGGQTDKTKDIDKVNAPSLSSKAVDHQEAQRPISDDPVHPDIQFPLHCSAHLNKGVPPPCLDEDLRLGQRYRPHARVTDTPIAQLLAINPVGVSDSAPCPTESSLHISDDDMDTLYLAADAPQTYREAMRQNYASNWVESISIEFENL